MGRFSRAMAPFMSKPLKQLSSPELLTRTKGLIAEERRITLLLIEHLEEIQARMLYAELGYGSLWEFATRELGLSEGAAQRRIQAMRLVRDVPEAKEALKLGELSLSNAAKVQSFRQAEKKLGRKADAPTLVAQVSGLSQRECERALFEISPEALPRERERVVSAEAERELKIVVSAELYDKLQRIRGLWAHAMPEASYAELLERMADETLRRLEKSRGMGEREGSGTGHERKTVEPGADHDAARVSTAAAAAVAAEFSASCHDADQAFTAAAAVEGERRAHSPLPCRVANASICPSPSSARFGRVLEAGASLSSKGGAAHRGTASRSTTSSRSRSTARTSSSTSGLRAGIITSSRRARNLAIGRQAEILKVNG
jgi:hypothetical protein